MFANFIPRSYHSLHSGRSTMPQQLIKYMDGDELAVLMKSGKVPKKDFLVIDVRDGDYAGGNIKDCLNQPSSDFLVTVHGLVRQIKEVPIVIFHCALSQVRGPKAARIYAETRQNLSRGNEMHQDIVILRDGFAQFQVKYKNDPELVENWDEDIWAVEWS